MSNISKVNHGQQEFEWHISKFDVSLMFIFLLLLYPLSINHSQSLVIACLFISFLGSFVIVIMAEGLIENVKFDKKNRFTELCKYCFRNYIYSMTALLAAFTISLEMNEFIFVTILLSVMFIGIFSIKYYSIALIINISSLLFLSYYAFSINNQGVTYIDFSDNTHSVRITQEESPYFNFNVLNTENIEVYKQTGKVEKDLSDKRYYVGSWTINASAKPINLKKIALIDLKNFSKIRELPEKLLAKYNKNTDKREELLSYLQGEYPNLIFSIDKLEYLELNTIVLW